MEIEALILPALSACHARPENIGCKLLQMRLGIGYGKAAELLEELTRRGMLAAPEQPGVSKQKLNTHPNGRPKFTSGGTLVNEDGSRSIFDDVDK